MNGMKGMNAFLLIGPDPLNLGSNNQHIYDSLRNRSKHFEEILKKHKLEKEYKKFKVKTGTNDIWSVPVKEFTEYLNSKNKMNEKILKSFKDFRSKPLSYFQDN